MNNEFRRRGNYQHDGVCKDRKNIGEKKSLKRSPPHAVLAKKKKGERGQQILPHIRNEYAGIRKERNSIW